jgi:predicted nuclease with RNAse H fold
MPIQTKDEAQDKASRKLDKNLKKRKKYVPLSEETWSDLSQRGASLAEQMEWIKLKKKEKGL